MLLVPVVVDGAWWGYIGFDDCVHEREWPQVEIDVLRAAAGTLAAAIHRERAETKLREAEATFRSIVETTPAITYQEHVSKGYDVQGSVLYVSPQVERILGYPARDWARSQGSGRASCIRTIATTSYGRAIGPTARVSRTDRSTG